MTIKKLKLINFIQLTDQKDHVEYQERTKDRSVGNFRSSDFYAKPTPYRITSKSQSAGQRFSRILIIKS